MRRAIRRAGWSLAVAGSLGLAAPALAQRAEPTAAAPRQPRTPAEDQDFRQEVQVELAWLADPVTFPYELEARCSGRALEVRGFVPNEAICQHALRVAHEQTTLPVRDLLRVHAGRATQGTAATAERLERAALDLLEENCAEHARDITVKARSNGQVTLRGTVPTLEEKLALSRDFRRLHGCTCVVNELQVARLDADGRAVLPAGVSAPRPAGTYPPRPEPLPVQWTEARAKPAESPRPIPLSPARGPAVSPWTAPEFAPPATRPVTTEAPAVSVLPAPKQAAPKERDLPPAAPRPAASGMSYVTTGAISFTDEPPPEGSVSSAISPDMLRMRVESVCGPKARHVRVAIRPGNQLAITLDLARGADGKFLWEQIKEMPELAPFKVHVEMYPE